MHFVHQVENKYESDHSHNGTKEKASQHILTTVLHFLRTKFSNRGKFRGVRSRILERNNNVICSCQERVEEIIPSFLIIPILWVV